MHSATFTLADDGSLTLLVTAPNGERSHTFTDDNAERMSDALDAVVGYASYLAFLTEDN